MGLTSKHLTVGDSFPTLPDDDGKLILLSMRFCPYAQRAHLALDAKGIPHHIVNVHLKQKPEWLSAYSRLEKVPALGLTDAPGRPYIHESLIVADYLDEKYTTAGRQLYPADPAAKAIDRLWIDRFASVISAFYRFVLLGPGGKPAPGAEADLNAGLADFETELRRRGTRFFGGDERPGMLDYMIWPWFERLAALQLAPSADERYELPAAELPLLTQFQADMQEDEAVKRTYLAPELHFKFIASHKAGKPDYELLHAV